MRVSLFNLSVVLLLLNVSFMQARVLRVPEEYLTIVGAIHDAVDGDSVMISPGAYHEHDISFDGKAITVMSTDPLNRQIVESTIVDADSLGGVFMFNSGEDSFSVLTGLTIRGGAKNIGKGGGIYCWESSPTITNNNITRNWTTHGGNGILCDTSSPTIMYNTITLNTGGFDGGGIYCVSYSYPIIKNNIIAWNSADYGGGIACVDWSTPEISNNVIYNNSAWRGGGMYISNTDFYETVTNMIFWDNTATEGQEIYLANASMLIIDYSDIEGGQSSVYSEGSILFWGDGMIDEDPLFEEDGFNLQLDSPCVDTGDSSILDVCLPPGLGEERSDIGAYGGPENCGWSLQPDVYLSINPTGPLTVPKGGTLYFNTRIQNNRENTVEGDIWLSVLIPNSTEVFIPEGLLNYPNPLHGQVFGYSFINLSNQLHVPTQADTGSYQLIGRIGNYPDGIVDEESFGFQVVE